MSDDYLYLTEQRKLLMRELQMHRRRQVVNRWIVRACAACVVIAAAFGYVRKNDDWCGPHAAAAHSER